MNDKERAVMQQALDALELHLNGCGVAIATRIAYDALREALAHSGEANEMVAEQAEQEPVAKVMMNRANQIMMQKPNGDYFDISKHVGEHFYTHPVRTKDLTDDELKALWENTKGGWLGLFRAVIAKDREKNNANNNT